MVIPDLILVAGVKYELVLTSTYPITHLTIRMSGKELKFNSE